jgi:hypothetical protein
MNVMGPSTVAVAIAAAQSKSWREKKEAGLELPVGLRDGKLGSRR